MQFDELERDRHLEVLLDGRVWTDRLSSELPLELVRALFDRDDVLLKVLRETSFRINDLVVHSRPDITPIICCLPRCLTQAL